MTESRQIDKHSHAQTGNTLSVTWVLLGLLLLLKVGMAWLLTNRSSDEGHTVSTVTLDKAVDSSIIDLSEFYTQIDSGDSWQELNEAAGYPQDCLQKIILTEGVQETCTWYNRETSVVVVLLNDRVISKTKVGL